MSFRRRLLLACTAAVAAAVALAAVLAYVVTRDVLRGQIDTSLRDAARMIDTVPPGVAPSSPAEKFRGDALQTAQLQRSALEGPVVFIQAFTGNAEPGPIGTPAVRLVGSATVADVAAGRRAPFFTERQALGRHQRVYVARRTNAEGAVVVARPLTEVDGTLGRLRLGLGAVMLAGIAAAMLLGRLATRTAVKPVAELTSAAEHVARTRDLTRRIEHDGDDELSRLAAAFNTMLEALAASQQTQRQLVADASHELRTPLTSLRTNLEVLGREGGLGDRDRERLRTDVVAQLEELTALVADLVDLAREEEPVAEREAVRLDELVAAAVERAARHAPAVRFATELEPAVVSGVASRLDRAVANLLENAAKFGPGGVVEVRLRGGELTVRDHGPGIATEDLPYVFDRFYRAASARGRPGSGLGLAIVRRVAEAHGGSAVAGLAPGGGAILRLRLPTAVPALSRSS